MFDFGIVVSFAPRKAQALFPEASFVGRDFQIISFAGCRIPRTFVLPRIAELLPRVGRFRDG